MTAQTSPNPAFSVPGRPSSAPPPASSAAVHDGLGRPSTPLGTTTAAAAAVATSPVGASGGSYGRLQRSLGPGGLAPAPPRFDHARADRALAIGEEDLALRTLGELRELDAELDRISVDASGLLTHALMLREKESQDKDVYNGMIQVHQSRTWTPLSRTGRVVRTGSLSLLPFPGTRDCTDPTGPRDRRRQNEDLVSDLGRGGKRTETVRQRPLEIDQVESLYFAVAQPLSDRAVIVVSGAGEL